LLLVIVGMQNRRPVQFHKPGETIMKKLVVACVALSMSAFAFAQTAAAPAAPAAKTAQQSKMVTCNADATGKKGDDRKTFMKECLSAKPAKPVTAQQNKMKTCNVEATGKKGDERKAFMKTCLSAK
jgi:Ni/Co efflux regulator RcnB